MRAYLIARVARGEGAARRAVLDEGEREGSPLIEARVLPKFCKELWKQDTRRRCGRVPLVRERGYANGSHEPKRQSQRKAADRRRRRCSVWHVEPPGRLRQCGATSEKSSRSGPPELTFPGGPEASIQCAPDARSRSAHERQIPLGVEACDIGEDERNVAIGPSKPPRQRRPVRIDEHFWNP